MRRQYSRVERIEYVNKNRLFWLPFAIIACLEIYYFRNVIFSDHLFGNDGDGRLLNLLAEHWFQFFQGNEVWAQTISFFPSENSFGYSDVLLGLGLPYSLLRLLGVNMFYAFKWTLIGLHAFGSYSVYDLLQNRLHFSVPISFVGVIMCAYSNMYITTGHAQLFAVYYVPFFFIMAFNAIHAYDSNPRKSFMFSIIAIITTAVIFYTAYYIGYFLSLFCIVLFIVFSILGHIQNIHVVPRIWNIIKNEWKTICFLVLLLIVIFLPLVSLYLPILRENGGYSYEAAIGFSPHIVDFINLDQTSILYRKILLAFPADTFQIGEYQIGYPLVSLGVFFLSCFFICKEVRSKGTRNPRSSRNESNPRAILITASVAISVLVCMALTLKIGDHFSAWYFVYKIFPGAGAIRAVGRFHVLLTFPLAFVVCSFLQGRMNTISKIGLRKLVSIAVAVFFIIEYSWAGGVYANWTSAQFGEFVNSVPTPPADCEVMYVKLSPMPDAVEPNWRLSLDAWQIAAHYDLKTINGYSGQVPPGWITDITSTNYEQSVANWVAENNLVHVYAYNLVTQQWEAPQFQ